MKREKLCKRLLQAMDMRGFRAVDLVERTGIPKGTLSYYMAGKTEPKADRLFLIARALDISEAWLLGFDVPMYRTDEQKKNDQLAALVVKMREDVKFYDLVSKLSEVDSEKLDLIDRLLAGLTGQ